MRCVHGLTILAVGLSMATWAGKAAGGEETADTGGNAAVDQKNAGKNDASETPVYLLTYDHGGIVLWGREHFLDRLRNAIEWLDRYPGFKIGLDNEAYTYDYMAEKEPAALEELRGYLKRYPGRFGIGSCTYGQPLSQFINEESNVRQIAYALRADREHLGTAPTIYLMSEHAMHSQIPQLLVGLGFEGAIMRTHFMMYGYNPTFDEAIGWWVGLDGSRLPTIPTYKEEGAEFGRTTVDNWILTRYPSEQSKMSLEEFRAKFSDISPLLASRADDAKLRREELVKQYAGNRQFQWVLLEEILPAFPSPQAELKTTPNDFHVRMPWGYCGNEIWNMSRRAEVGVLTAERLAAVEHLLGGEDRGPDLRKSWNNLLVAQHHDIQICGLLDDARNFLPASVAFSDRVADASLRAIASSMEGGTVTQVTLYNPLSWAREEWVEVTLSLKQGLAENLAVKQGERPIPAVLLGADYHPDGSIQTARFAVNANVPPLGFASYSVQGKDARPQRDGKGIAIDEGKLTITTPHARIRLDENGGIASLVDRRTGRILLAKGKRSGFFEGTIEGRNRTSEGKWTLEPTDAAGIPHAVAREKGTIGGIPYELTMTFRTETPRIDCRVTFHFNGERIGLLSENRRDSHSPFVHDQKLRFKLFPTVSDPVVGIRDLPFAVAETTDFNVEGNYWTALAGNDGGVAIFNRGTMGCVRERDGGFSLPLAYAMYYVWGTRMLTGDFTYEFAIYPFLGDWRRADLHRRALEYSFPCVAVCTDAGDGQLGNTFRPLDISSSDVLVSALYSEGGRTYIRLYEHRGGRSEVSLKYLMGQSRLTEVDLAGKTGKPVDTPLVFEPWQIKTIRIDPAM